MLHIDANNVTPINNFNYLNLYEAYFIYLSIKTIILYSKVFYISIILLLDVPINFNLISFLSLISLISTKTYIYLSKFKYLKCKSSIYPYI